MTLIRLLDLDGTICDDRWRRIEHDRGNVYAYHELCAYDDFVNRDLVSGDFKLIILSGRPIIKHRATELWLTAHAIKVFNLQLKPFRFDSMSTVEYKRLVTLEYLNRLEGVEFEAYDNDPKNIEMFKSLNVESHLVSIP